MIDLNNDFNEIQPPNISSSQLENAPEMTLTSEEKRSFLENL